MQYLIMVVANQKYAETLSEFLKTDDHEIALVPDSNLALKMINKRRPDLLLLDISVPEDKVACLNLARAVQRLETAQGLPVVILSGINDEYPFNFGPQDLNSEWFPVSGYLEKPVDAEVLRFKINMLLKRTTVQD